MIEQPQFLSFSPDVEVKGRVIQSASRCINKEDIIPILKKYDLVTVDPETWYPLQLWLNILKDVSTQNNSTYNFVSLGLKLVEDIPFLPEWKDLSFEQMLHFVPQSYAMDHQGGDIGSIDIEKINAQHIRLVLRVPYPDDLFYGTTYGVARRFAPAYIQFTVRYNDNVARRDQGGEKTVIDVSWNALL